MSKYKRYDKYKDSGVEWLGKIPGHWEVAGFKKYLATIVDYRGKTPEKKEEGIFLVTARNIKKGKLDYTCSQEYISKENYDSVMSRGKVKKGEVLFTTEAPLGEVANIDKEDIALAQRIIKFCGNKNKLNNYYLKFFIMSFHFQSSLKMFSSGSTAQGIKAERLGYLKKILPPVNEQENIVKFLDHETGKIDKLIEKQEQLIELLKEKRQAVISHAVTKGLNPDVPMKDSGVEWLEEIPVHWKVSNIKYLGKLQNGISKGAEYFGEGYPFVNYGDIYSNLELPRTGSGLANSSKDEQKLYSVKEGDVFFTRTSETVEEIGLASTCLKSIEKAIFSGFIIRFRPDKNVLDKYFSKYYFRSLIHRVYFVKEMNLVTRASLSQDLLGKLQVLLPSLQEQNDIGMYLEEKNNLFEKSISSSKEKIELLKERRTSLISAAVTGKIKISNGKNK